jgi:hypothetical protein
MPSHTPFFDILLHRRTPTDDRINHLVVQCGENHVNPLTSILSAHLNGRLSALFLPRLAFASLSSDKIKSYFEMHQKYARSLKPLMLSPAINNLDLSRKEMLPDGNVLNRTTREWASSLTTLDGQHARCDVVNGGPDQKTYLLVPGQHIDHIRTELQKYRLRLNILGRREARFRDSIPGLPSEIHIDLSTRHNLEFLDELTSAELWRAAPDSVRGQNSSDSPFDPPSVPPVEPTPLPASPAVTSAFPHLPRPDSDNGTIPSPVSRSSKARTRNVQFSDNHTTSTASDTRSMASTMARLNELESILKKQQKEIEKINKISNKLESKLHTFDNLDDRIKQTMEAQQAATLDALQSKFTDIMDSMFTRLTSTTVSGISASAVSTSVSTHPIIATAQKQLDHQVPSGSASVRSFNSRSTQSSGSISGGRQPPKKLQRSLKEDMDELSLDSYNSNDLTGILPPPSFLDPNSISTSSSLAPTDLDIAQYKTQREPDGGESR